MNVKLYTLFLSLTLVATPAVQAMRSKSAIVLAASLRKNILPALSTELARTLKTTKVESSHFFKNPRNYFALAAGSCAVAALFDAITPEADEAEEQNAEVAEEQKFVSINNLSMSDVPGILEALVGATENDKVILAQKISRIIIRYRTPTLIKMLKVAEGRSHRVLVQALKKNITWYSLDDISLILKEDKSRHTHEVVATALKNNYNYFTSYTIAGLSLYSSDTWRKQYVEVLKSVNPAQQHFMMQPILNNIGTYDVLNLLRHVDKSLNDTILTAFTQSKNPNLSYYDTGRDLMYLLERTKAYDQTNIAHAMIQNINFKTYNSWHYSGLHKYCNEDAKKIIAKAITKEVANNPDKYTNDNYNRFNDSILETTAQLCTLEQQEIITDSVNTVKASKWRTHVEFNFASQKWEDISKFKN